VLESEKGEIKKKKKRERKREKELVKRYFITMDSKPTVQQGLAGSRQLCQTAVRTSYSSDLGSTHHLQCYSKRDLLKICKLKAILFIIYSLGMAKGSLLPQMRTHQA